MDRTARIDRISQQILAADARIGRQKGRIVFLDEREMHVAAAMARETLLAMIDRLSALRFRQAAMIDTARVLEDARRAKAQREVGAEPYAS